MSDERTNPPELVIRPNTPRWQWWVAACALVLLLVFHVVEGVELVHEGLRVGSVLAYLVWVAMTALVAIYLVGSEPLQVRISSDGMTWRGLGWSRTRPWSDVEQVGTYRHELGAGGHWIAARLAPQARRASGRAFPRRLVSASLEGSDEVAGLVRLTAPTWKPGLPGRRRPATPHPPWDVPDDEIIDAVRAHAGHRWVEELGPIDRP